MTLAFLAAGVPRGIADAPPAVSFAGPVTGGFYANPTDTGHFTATPQDQQLFSQGFDVVDFNPDPSAVACSNATGVDQSTRPFTDVTPQPDGSCTTQPAEGNGYQAGVGDLNSFDAAYTAMLAVSGGGVVDFTVSADDGWIIGMGQDVAGDQPTYVSGSLVHAPEATPFQGYPVVGAYNLGESPTPRDVSINFPAAGTYPVEMDYAECCSGPLTLTLWANGSLIGQSGEADLGVTQVGTPATTPGGSEVTYESTVTNAGPAAATGATLTDTIPGDTTLVSATASQGSCSGDGTVTCDLGSLDAGASATVDVTVDTPCVAEEITNASNVSADQPDPNPGNNASTAATTLETPCSGASGEVEDGGVVTTDPNGQGPQPELGIYETGALIVPAGVSGAVDIALSSPPPPPANCPSFRTLLATTSQPAGTRRNWLRLVFVYAACAIPPGTNIHKTTIEWSQDATPDVFVPLPRCTGLHDRPDPCVRSKTVLQDGTFRYVVFWSGTGDPGWRPQ